LSTALLHEASPEGLLVTLDDLSAQDRELMHRIGGGDEEAFRGLFARYAPTAQALAFRVIRQQFLAEEIVQEAFLAVWRDPRAYVAERGSVRAWLMSLVHHRAVDLVRREEAQRRRAADVAADVPDAERDDPATMVVEEIGFSEERAAVRGALGELPPEQREVIELMYFAGLSQSRISDKLGLPLGTVKSRTLLGMRRLRAALPGTET